VTILEALADRNLFGALPAFRDLETWGAWEASLAAVYGLPMTEAQLETFRAHTGRSAPRTGGYSEAVCIVGRQSGKSQVAAMIATFEAIRATRAEGRGTYAVLVCQDARSALRTLFRYASQPFDDAPILRGGIVSKTADSIELENGVTIAAYPCRPHGIRGIRACVAVCDELAFFRSSENVPQDVEMLRALRPCLATTGGKLIVLSSPYAQSGALWELHRRHFGKDDSTTLVWQASAPDMNPSLPADYLERTKQDDPEAYRSEVLGEFRAGISTFLDPEALERCVVPDRGELPPVDDLS
jgi:Terminase large subunit, T4likevirus-type, N-terminal